MLAQGWLNPVDTARAKLQEQIGLFLSGRAKLMRMMNNPSLQIQGEAKGLYAVQLQLETRLQDEIYPKLSVLSTGVWDASDILMLGGFTTLLMKQISDVSNLEQKAGGAPATGALFGMDTTTMLMGAGVILVLGVMGGVFFGRRPII